MKRTSDLLFRALVGASALGGAVGSYGQAVTVDGTREYLYGFPRVWQTVQTSFNSNTSTTQEADGSELVAAYSYIGGGNLNLFFAGNLQNDGRKIFIFIDSQSVAGQNRLLSSNTGIAALSALGGVANGLTFESGFTADHAFVVHADSTQAFVNYSPLPSAGSGVSTFLGSSALGASSGALSGGNPLMGVEAVLRNGNTVGVASGTAIGQVPDIGASGFEISIPLSQLGTIDQSMKVFAFIGSADGSVVSNQCLPDVANTGTVGSFSSPTTTNFDSGVQGVQFFYVQPRTKKRLLATRLGEGVDQGSNAAAVALVALNPGESYAASTPRLALFNGVGSPGLTERYSATTVGYLTRSVDGRTISTTGVEANIGVNAGANPVASLARCVGMFNSDGSVSYRLVSSTFSTAEPRAVAQFGLDRCFVTAGTGLFYVPNPSGAATLTASGNYRVANIFNNRFYATQQTAFQSFSQLPLTGPLTGTAFSSAIVPANAHDFAFADSRTLYICDETNGQGVQKYTYSGTAWALSYTSSALLTSGKEARSITLSKDNSGRNVLHIVTDESNPRVVQITDMGTHFANDVPMVTSSPGYMYRGVDWSPELWTAPVANGDSNVTDEDTSVGGNVLTNDTGEAVGNAEVVSPPNPATGSVSLNANGSYTFTPAANYHGPASFTYRFTDGDTFTAPATVTITVNSVNDAPTLAAIPNQNATPNQPLSFSAVGSDPNDTPPDALTYSLIGAPAGASISPSTGAVSWTPTPAQGGQDYDFTVRVTDNGTPNLFDEENVHVTVEAVPNEPPVLTWPGNKTVETGHELTVDIDATDPNLPNDELTFSIEHGPEDATINPATGELSWTPAKAGNYCIKVCVEDELGLSVTKLFSVTAGTPGSVKAWGSNSSGELGDGTTTNRWEPVTALGANNIVSISGGGWFSLALLGDGTLQSWGSNGDGRLGDGTNTNSITPVSVVGLTDIVEAVAGNDSGVALHADGRVSAWGRNDYGQLGDGTAINRYYPANVDGLSEVVAIAGGGRHHLALLSDGTVRAWGWNQFGQLGNGVNLNQHSPVSVQGLSNVVELSGGAAHSLAVLEDGTVRAWGHNGYGQLGDGTNTVRYSPVTVASLTGVTAVSAGNGHSVALLASGGLCAWGLNNYGQLGDGSNTNRNLPVLVPSLSNVSALSATHDHNLAIVSGGDVWSWGANFSGGLGNGTNMPSNNPVSVIGIFHASIVSAGLGHSLAVVEPAPPNDPPFANNDAYSTNENTALVVQAASGLRVNDTDDGPLEDLVVSVVTPPNPAQGSVVVNQDGSFVFTPVNGFAGVCTFTYKVNDGDLDSNTATVTITVNDVNTAPYANSLSFTTPEGVPVSTLASASDAEDDPLTYSIVTPPAHGVMSGTGPNWIYTPNGVFSGADSFTYKVNDGHSDSNIATVSITVNDTVAMAVDVKTSPAPNYYGSMDSYEGWEGRAINRWMNANGAPELLRSDDPTAFETPNEIVWWDTTVTNFSFWLGELYADDPFEQELGHRPTFTTRIKGNGTRFSLSGLEFDISSNDPALDSGDTANMYGWSGWWDGTDPGDPGQQYYNPWTIGLDYGADRIRGTSDDLVYDNGQVAETQIDELIYVGLGYAFEAITDGSVSDPALALMGTRAYLERKIAATGNQVDISVTFRMRSGDHESSILGQGTQVLPLVSNNTAPLANDQSVSVVEDDSVGITLSGSDSDHFEVPLGFRVVAGPAHGQLSGTAPNLVYTPDPDFSGDDSFTFVSTDVALDSNVATVHVHVTPVNDPPTLDAIGNRVIGEGSNIIIMIGGSDVDSAVLTYSAEGLPPGASFEGNIFSWTPSELQGPGTYPVTFRVSDGAGGEDNEVVVITVNEVNEAPVANDLSVTTEVNDAVAITLSGTDTDLPANTLGYVIVDEPEHGTLSGTAPYFTYTPDENYSGPDSFTYKVNDGTLDSNTATVTIDVTGTAITLNITMQGFVAEGPVTRGLTMWFGGTAGGSTPPVDISRDVTFDAAGHAQIVLGPQDGIDVLEDLSTYAISVKDELHTLRSLEMLEWDGESYTVELTLLGGNLNRDNKVDIGDYVVYSVRYGIQQAQDTPLSFFSGNPLVRHADISGDRDVDSEEYSFILANFGKMDQSLPGNTLRGREDIRTRISVRGAVEESGDRRAAYLDRNGDGWITINEAKQPLPPFVGR